MSDRDQQNLSLAQTGQYIVIVIGQKADEVRAIINRLSKKLKTDSLK